MSSILAGAKRRLSTLGLPATRQNIRPKSQTKIVQVIGSSDNRAKIVGVSSGVAPGLPAIVSLAVQSSNSKCNYPPEKMLCPQVPCRGFIPFDACSTPLGLRALRSLRTQGAPRARRPWALLFNAFGVSKSPGRRLRLLVLSRLRVLGVLGGTWGCGYLGTHHFLIRRFCWLLATPRKNAVSPCCLPDCASFAV